MGFINSLGNLSKEVVLSLKPLPCQGFRDCNLICLPKYIDRGHDEVTWISRFGWLGAGDRRS